MALKILRASQAQEATGLPRSSFYSQVAKGLLPPSIQLGPRSVGWVETEINAVNVARILGWIFLIISAGFSQISVSVL